MCDCRVLTSSESGVEDPERCLGKGQCALGGGKMWLDWPMTASVRREFMGTVFDKHPCNG